jgi:hypothetical protein
VRSKPRYIGNETSTFLASKAHVTHPDRLPLSPGRTVWFLLGLALVFRLAIAWGNYGFVAMDDYEEMLRLAVPAQQVAGVGYIVETAAIRSPLPKLWIYTLGQAAGSMGLEDPVNQVRFIYTILGLLGLAAAATVWWMFHRIGRPDWAIH